MSFVIRQATRTGVKPLIVIYSESGCGKTFSALLLARGLAGPKGKVIMADSESGRGSLYADIPEIGGYETLEFNDFAPKNYIAAMDAIEEAGAAVGIIDSGSHAWEGIGGVLDMASANEESSKRPGLHNWKTPKLEHAKWINRLLRSKIPWIVCLRAKYKTRQKKIDGKTVIVKDDVTSPIQSEDFIFEATCHMEILPNHTIILTKEGHPELKTCFPADRITPITVQTGQCIGRWCANAGATSPKTETDTKELKKSLWSMLKPVRGSDSTWAVAESWLRVSNLLKDGETVNNLNAAQLQTILNETPAKLATT